ncbi:MAG: right-handed parallel beta-helix repeat-containing protein, partial [Planctomycetaceae bacterium]|nr:right-handed parallel beta-helix repeat-containing protein [Planctomycetaceae bacterium]
ADPAAPNGDGAFVVVSGNVINQSFDPSPQHPGHGMQINASNASRIINFSSINDTVLLNKGDGIALAARDTARVDSLTIQGANIDRNNGRGINLEAHDGAIINANSTIGGYDIVALGQNVIAGQRYVEGNVITGNTGDGVRFLASGGAVINGNLIANTITSNGGNGANLVVDNGGTLNFGTTANNEVISRNNILNNTGAGIQLSSSVTATGPAGRIDALVQNNTISGNLGGGIMSEMFGVTTSNIVNLNVGGSAAQANTIDGNSVAGVSFAVSGNGQGTFSLTNASVSNTLADANGLFGDGVVLTRADSSLLTAVVDRVTASGNVGDGLRVDVSGNEKTDPNQPLTGTLNTVDWTNSLFNENGNNGASFTVRGDAQLIADGSNNVLTGNGLNGVQVRTTGNASLGDATIGLPPGQRVVMQGITSTNNGQDGFNISATDDSRTLLEITSNRTAPAAVGLHAGLNKNGDTNISGNGRDGIRISTTGGTSDILVTAGTGNTTIDGNGTAAGGNGIRWDAAGTSDAIVRVEKTTITNSIAGLSEDTNGNGILDAGEDTNGNSDIDVADGDGVQYNITGRTTATLIVGGNGVGNTIRNNADDGVAVTATGSGVNVSRPIVSIVDNTIGGELNGMAAGNGGDGVSLNVFGGTAIGLAPGAVDAIGPLGDGDGLSIPENDGVQENGPIVQLTLTDNVVSYNGHRGVNVLLTGAAGERDRENGNALFDPVRITLTGNTIASSGDEGVYYRADSDMNQSRFVYLENPTIGPPNARVLLFDNTNYSPFRAEFTSLNGGSVNGNTAYLSPYLNLRTVQNSLLTVTGNTVQNNGVNAVTGEGMFIEVGTGAYVAADVRDNTFGGNLDEDFHTESFLSAGNTFNSVDNTAIETFDFVYLDDTAQLDLRFTNNAGNMIDVTSNGAIYTNADPLKTQFFGTIGVTQRQADLFQIDDGNNLDNPNNTFINFGITQDIDGTFSANGYNLRGIADPLFPNLGFAPFLP